MTRDTFTTSRGWTWGIEQAGEGPPVFALHGVGGGAYFFRGLAERLGLRYRVIATDLPAPPPALAAGYPASMAEWADGLCELLRARAGGPVVIAGHSLGTILALEVWRRCPELVRALVFIGGLPEVRDLMRQRLRDRIVAIAAGGMQGWGPRISPGVFGRRALDERPELVGLFERLLETHNPVAYARNVEILVEASATDVVPTVHVPCLSINGAEDVYAPPDFVAAFLDRLPSPCRRLLMPGVGHMPFFEAPVEFAQAVGAFLDGLPSPRT